MDGSEALAKDGADVASLDQNDDDVKDDGKLQKKPNRDRIAEEIDGEAERFNQARMSERRRMIERYPKFVNVKDWNALPKDIKKFLKEQKK